MIDIVDDDIEGSFVLFKITYDSEYRKNNIEKLNVDGEYTGIISKVDKNRELIIVNDVISQDNHVYNGIIVPFNDVLFIENTG